MISILQKISESKVSEVPWKLQFGFQFQSCFKKLYQIVFWGVLEDFEFNSHDSGFRADAW